MHSLSGGTGSGCTSRLVEELRQQYGWKKSIMSQSVAPFSQGELPLQHYNNLLCLSHLDENVDCICLHQNDDVMKILEIRHRQAELANRVGLFIRFRFFLVVWIQK